MLIKKLVGSQEIQINDSTDKSAKQRDEGECYKEEVEKRRVDKMKSLYIRVYTKQTSNKILH